MTASLAGISARMQNCLNLTPGRTWPGRASPLPRAGSAGGEETKERVLAAKQERAHPIETSHFTLILLMTLPRLREGQSLAQGHTAGQFAPSHWSFLVCAFGEDKLPTNTPTLDLQSVLSSLHGHAAGEPVTGGVHTRASRKSCLSDHPLHLLAATPAPRPNSSGANSSYQP